MTLSETGMRQDEQEKLLLQLQETLKERYGDGFCLLSDSSGKQKALIALTNSDVQSTITVKAALLPSGELAGSIYVLFPFTLRLVDEARRIEVQKFTDEMNDQLRATPLRFITDAVYRPIIVFAPAALENICESVDKAISASETFAPYILHQMFDEVPLYSEAAKASVEWMRSFGGPLFSNRVKKHALHFKGKIAGKGCSNGSD